MCCLLAHWGLWNQPAPQGQGHPQEVSWLLSLPNVYLLNKH